MKYAWIRTIYFYLVALIALVIIIVNGAMLANMALKTWVFPEAGKVEQGERFKYVEPARPVGEKGLVTSEKSGAESVAACSERCNFTAEEKSKAETWLGDYATWEERSRDGVGQRQLEAARSIGFLLAAIPVFAYHWAIVRRESLTMREKKSTKQNTTGGTV